MCPIDKRTNFVKIGNLPAGMGAEELFKLFDPYGVLLEMTAVSESSIIVTYMRRSAVRNCKELIHNQLYLGNNRISAEYYYPRDDPAYASCPILQGLGKNIANDAYVYDYRAYRPWATGNPLRAAAMAAAAQQPDSSQVGTAGGAGGVVTRAAAGVSTRGTASAVGEDSGDFNKGERQVLVIESNTGGVRNAKPVVPQPGTSSSGEKRKIVIGGPYAEMFNKHTVPWRLPSDDREVDECPICLDELGDLSTYNIFSDSTRSLSLNMCNHAFHQACLEMLMRKAPAEFLQCPSCKKVYGIRTGTRPLTGSITHKILDIHLPGYEQHRTIEITFNFSNGKQGPEHPHPGATYYSVDFPRKAYLPDNDRGIEALHGIYIAWDQRLMFTVGRSLTTNRDDVITWNDIHMKTKIQAVDHGYPDPHYLNNLIQELKGFGITDATISSHMAKYPTLRERGTV